MVPLAEQPNLATGEGQEEQRSLVYCVMVAVQTAVRSLNDWEVVLKEGHTVAALVEGQRVVHTAAVLGEVQKVLHTVAVPGEAQKGEHSLVPGGDSQEEALKEEHIAAAAVQAVVQMEGHNPVPDVDDQEEVQEEERTDYRLGSSFCRYSVETR